MKIKPCTKILKWYFDGYQMMIKSHPKAARKERNRKKWLKRFGPGLTEQLYDPNPFPFRELISKDPFRGAYLAIPYKFS